VVPSDNPPANAISLLSAISEYAFIDPDSPTIDEDIKKSLRNDLIVCALCGEDPERTRLVLLEHATADIRRQLSNGWLKAWGRIGSILAPLDEIPAHAWGPWTKIDWSGRRVTLQSGETFFDVEVAPVEAAITAQATQAAMTKSVGFSMACARAWYLQWVAENERLGWIPSRDEDYKAAKERFPAITHEAMRDLRGKEAPEHWKAPGRRPKTA
jgi:hypothetical protein